MAKEELAIVTATIKAQLDRKDDVDVRGGQHEGQSHRNFLPAHQEVAAELAESCGSHPSKWEERQKCRADELVTVHDTRKVLNDEDAPEVQRSSSSKQLR